MLAVMLTLVPIFAIMLLGAWAEHRHILHKDTASVINGFVYSFSLPILLFYIMSQVNVEHISWRPALAFVLGLAITQFLGTYISRVYGNDKNTSTMAGLVTCFPNAAFMGISVVMLVFPSNVEAEIYVGIAALLPILSILYTDSVLNMRKNQNNNCLSAIKNMLNIIMHSPPLIGASLGLLVSQLGIELAQPIDVTAKMLGSTAAPCSLFCMGMSLSAQLSHWTKNTSANTQSKKFAQSPLLLHIILTSCKLLINPLLVFIFCYALGVDGVAAAVMIIIAGMPTAIVCYVIAERHEVFTQDCTIITVINTLLSCLTVPLIIMLLQ